MHLSLMSTKNIATLKKLLSEEMLDKLNQWPKLLGGGNVGGELLVAQVVRILQIPFSSVRIDLILKFRKIFNFFLLFLVNIC